MKKDLLNYKMTQSLMYYIFNNIQLCVKSDFIGYVFPIPGKEKYILILDIANPHWTIGKLKSKSELKELNRHQYKSITKYLCKINWIIPSHIEEPFEEFNELLNINPKNIIIFPEEEQSEYSCALPPDNNIMDIEYLGD